MENNKPKISFVLPCLNEEQTIRDCLNKIQEAIKKYQLDAEVIVADNGSTDKSAEIAQEAGARVVYEPKRGYGNAYHRGMTEAKGEIIVMGDADNTYNFLEVDRLLKPILEEDCDLVIGNRFAGLMEKGAMNLVSRIGNFILTKIMQLFFRVPVSDVYSGFRAFKRISYQKINLQASGMEYALEMIIKATFKKLKIREVPISYAPRIGESKLSPFKDGWRSLKFILLFAPNWLFLGPSIFFFFSGLILLIAMTFGPIKIGRMILHLHPMFLGSFLVILGCQIFSFGLLTKIYAYLQGLMPKSKLVDFYLKHFSLERLILTGIIFILIGISLTILVFIIWAKSGFGALSEVRKSLTALTLIVLGIQIIYTGFFFSIFKIGIRE
jgi:glycosyltransferase involved in cell wall biosynthesis